MLGTTPVGETLAQLRARGTHGCPHERIQSNRPKTDTRAVAKARKSSRIHQCEMSRGATVPRLISSDERAIGRLPTRRSALASGVRAWYGFDRHARPPFWH
jgi:hypothetical protein